MTLAGRVLADLRAQAALLAAGGGPASGLALRTALATVLSVLAALALHLDSPDWAGITALAIVQKDVASTLARSIDRAAGTVAGAAIGFVGVGVIDDHLLFGSLCIAAVALGIYGEARVTHGYAMLLGGLTAILVLFGSLDAPEQALTVAVYRALEILVGIVVSFLVDYALCPTGLLRASLPPKPGLFARPVDRSLLALALTAGISGVLIIVIWEGFQLPGFGQTPISAFLILAAMRGEPWLSALNRIGGCFVGGVYGLVAMAACGDALLPWLALMLAGLFVTAHVKHGGKDSAYAGHQAAIAVVLAMVQGFAPSDDILPAIDRLVGIAGGILVVAVGEILLLPVVRGAIDRVLAQPGEGVGSRRGDATDG
ncbi:MAG: FUSC family protein [Methylobacterium frigidaeris]